MGQTKRLHAPVRPPHPARARHVASPLCGIAFGIVVLLATAAVPGGEKAGAGKAVDDGGEKASSGTSILDLFAAAGVRTTRAKAERLKESLPAFQGAVELPSESLLYGWIRGLSATAHRRPGTPEGHRAESWTAERFEELGLKEVTRDRFPITVWEAEEWSLRVEGVKVPCFFLLNSGFTPSGGVTAPMIYVGEGGLGRFAGQRPRGKIVVAEAAMSPGRPDSSEALLYFTSDPEGYLATDNRHFAPPWNLLGEYSKLRLLDVYWQAQAAGAAGIVVILRDYPSAGNSFYWPHDGSPKSLPGLYVGKRDGAVLREQAKMGKSATLVLRGKVELGWTSNVWGTLPGASDEVVLLTSNHDSPHRGAVGNGCGMAQLLAQAWAWARVPPERRPRTLVFLATGGHTFRGKGAEEFAKGHPELMRRVRATLSLEQVGAKEVKEGGGNGAYAPTGRPQASAIYLPRQADLVAAVMRALETKPFAATVVRPPELGITLSDAGRLVDWAAAKGSGYPRKAGLPSASWIGAPLYLLDEEDSLDKVDRERLAPLAATVAEIVKGFLLLE